MNKRQLNYLTMAKATLACMESRKSEWNSINPVKKAVTVIGTLVSTLDTEIKKQYNLQTTGLTEDKNQKFENMCAQAFKTASKIKAFAKVTGNKILLDAVNFSESALKAGSENETIVQCKTILEKAQENKKQLTDYQVSQESINQLKQAIEAYTPLVAQRDATGDERVAATARINKYITNIREQLDILDDLTEGFFDEEFIDIYRQARQIIDR